MKQYCRYCAFCIDNGYNDYYCTVHKKFLKTSTVKSVNKCKDYAGATDDIITGKNIFKKESDEE